MSPRRDRVLQFVDRRVARCGDLARGIFSGPLRARWDVQAIRELTARPPRLRFMFPNQDEGTVITYD